VLDPDSRWEVMLYAKNLFDTTRRIQRNADPGAFSYTALNAVTRTPIADLGGAVVADYREVALTAPREFGVNLRYSF
jgi:iron complex outermembrane receptor protein